MDRAALLALLDETVASLGANDPQRLPLAPRLRYTENSVEFPFGDGAWKTVTGIGEYRWDVVDVRTSNAARFGVLEESGDKALFVLRIAALETGALAEIELLVARATDSGVPFLNTDPAPRPELTEPVPPASRTERARMLSLADGYFSTLEQNDGTLHTRFTADCERRENGVQTTHNPQPDLAPVAKMGCEEQFLLGYYRFDNWIRARRYPLVDEEQGVVLCGGFIDHDGQTRDYQLTNGETRTGFFLRPHSFAYLEAFKIRDDAISAVEAVFHFVPYRMRSPWAQDERDPRLAKA
ncbi:hypothetical protein M2341_001038 [Sphingobium sp. B7D2B]|uniref:hypothetical protein n=1 Tax=Sphingobium sp. B7D2B TaxID=2940583 RepID=UPI00222589D6|nr:hypothetical protein [Sphingobium sp. B7D2B]MCW2365591.1 hypothetical protein [Sphingobium sp. B7D2B]